MLWSHSLSSLSDKPNQADMHAGTAGAPFTPPCWWRNHLFHVYNSTWSSKQVAGVSKPFQIRVVFVSWHCTNTTVEYPVNRLLGDKYKRTNRMGIILCPIPPLRSLFTGQKLIPLYIFTIATHHEPLFQSIQYNYCTLRRVPWAHTCNKEGGGGLI